MRIALDYHDRRVSIENAESNKEYFCPFCGAPLVTRKGEERQHHFAHKARHLCSDPWEHENKYDMSEWHNQWQNRFPVDNQEIKVTLGQTIHRADVMISRTVIEFQHSIMKAQAFDDRNNFYYNLGYKVIWLFDLSEEYNSDQFEFEKENNQLKFTWKNPKKAFNSYDVKGGVIDLFFQFENADKKSIVRVTDVSLSGFSSFTATDFMDVSDFMEYVGVINGECPLPDVDVISANQTYISFKDKYKIQLNDQQERALQSIEGNTLLLAVPGSGKTTVLISKIGYMIIEKGIDPKQILALTFNKRAAEEMKLRFGKKFGVSLATQVEFRTINSLCYEIYRGYCRFAKQKERIMINEGDQFRIIKKIYQEYYKDDEVTDNDIRELISYIGYVKNMEFSKTRIKSVDKEYRYFSDIYTDYQAELKKSNLMDYDDQLIYAKYILEKSPSNWNTRFKYICVDEAQDTSLIQHEIIQILSRNGNVFMVGDEDQSIYGFRAAFPKALLNFKTDYNNPYILKMERNYRSVLQIVNVAQTFISQNTGRYEKIMTAERTDYGEVKKITVSSRHEQYVNLINEALNRTVETAFIYRNNSTSVIFIDWFQRLGIPYECKNKDYNFFDNKIVKDIVAYLSLSINPYDYNALEQICNKGIIYLRKQQKKCAVNKCKYNKMSVFDSIDEQMQYVQYRYRNRAERFRSTMNDIRALNTEEAINYICENGYNDYLTEKGLFNCENHDVETLKLLAMQEDDKAKFLNRLKEIEELSKTEGIKGDNPVVLSTIHGCKGLEYDTVFLVDVIDGCLPSDTPYFVIGSKDDSISEQEERRMFYVALTRAKNNLYVFDIKNRDCTFIDEISDYL